MSDLHKLLYPPGEAPELRVPAPDKERKWPTWGDLRPSDILDDLARVGEQLLEAEADRQYLNAGVVTAEEIARSRYTPLDAAESVFLARQLDQIRPELFPTYENQVYAPWTIDTACGTDLDRLAAMGGVRRVYGESDASLRDRTRQALRVGHFNDPRAYGDSRGTYGDLHYTALAVPGVLAVEVSNNPRSHVITVRITDISTAHSATIVAQNQVRFDVEVALSNHVPVGVALRVQLDTPMARMNQVIADVQRDLSRNFVGASITPGTLAAIRRRVAAMLRERGVIDGSVECSVDPISHRLQVTMSQRLPNGMSHNVITGRVEI